MHLARSGQHLEDRIDSGLFPVQQLSQLGCGSRPCEPPAEQPLSRLEQPASSHEGVVIALRRFGLGKHIIHGGADGVDQPGVEAAMRWLVMLYRRDQPDGAFLKEITERDAALPAGPRRLEDQVKVVLDQRSVGGLSLLSLGGKEAALLFGREARIACHLGAIIVLRVILRPRFGILGHRLILVAACRKAGDIMSW
jgi:hypothetical protein